MSKFALLTRGGDGYGWGHVARTGWLAAALREQVPEAEIAVGVAGPDWVVDRLKSTGTDCTALGEPDAKRAWLTPIAPIDLAVIDLLHIEPEIPRTLRRYCRRIAAMSDLAEHPPGCDQVFWPQSLNGTAGSGDPSILSGPAYFVMGPEFRTLRGVTSTPMEPLNAEHLLVNLGGEAQPEACLRLAAALDGMQGLWQEVDWILGATCPDDVAHTLRHQLEWVRFSDFADDMPARLARADMAIIAGGFLKFEAACCGTPSLIIAVSDHQKDLARQFATTGAGDFIGTTQGQTVEQLRATIMHLREDRARRQRMSRIGRDLVDGRGAERVAAALIAIAGRH